MWRGCAFISRWNVLLCSHVPRTNAAVQRAAVAACSRVGRGEQHGVELLRIPLQRRRPIWFRRQVAQLQWVGDEIVELFGGPRAVAEVVQARVRVAVLHEEDAGSAVVVIFGLVRLRKVGHALGVPGYLVVANVQKVVIAVGSHRQLLLGGAQHEASPRAIHATHQRAQEALAVKIARHRDARRLEHRRRNIDRGHERVDDGRRRRRGRPLLAHVGACPHNEADAQSGVVQVALGPSGRGSRGRSSRWRACASARPRLVMADHVAVALAALRVQPQVAEHPLVLREPLGRAGAHPPVVRRVTAGALCSAR